jgi:hypothetical protein
VTIEIRMGIRSAPPIAPPQKRDRWNSRAPTPKAGLPKSLSKSQTLLHYLRLGSRGVCPGPRLEANQVRKADEVVGGCHRQELSGLGTQLVPSTTSSHASSTVQAPSALSRNLEACPTRCTTSCHVSPTACMKVTLPPPLPFRE